MRSKAIPLARWHTVRNTIIVGLLFAAFGLVRNTTYEPGPLFADHLAFWGTYLLTTAAIPALLTWGVCVWHNAEVRRQERKAAGLQP